MHDFEKIVYLEMQKSGSSFVNRFMKECCLLKEVKHRKHQPIRDDYDSGKFYFITIRNPIGLYSSLYRYGLDGRGKVYQALRNRGKRKVYSSIESFIEFISNPRNARFMPEGYTEEIANQVGFFSFRFMRLSLQFPSEKINRQLAIGANLLDLESKFITDLEIKNENLEGDLERLSTELFPDFFDQGKVRKLLDRKEKVNTSTRPHDDDLEKKTARLLELISSKEQLLFSRY